MRSAATVVSLSDELWWRRSPDSAMGEAGGSLPLSDIVTLARQSSRLSNWPAANRPAIWVAVPEAPSIIENCNRTCRDWIRIVARVPCATGATVVHAVVVPAADAGLPWWVRAWPLQLAKRLAIAQRSSIAEMQVLNSTPPHDLRFSVFLTNEPNFARDDLVSHGNVS